MKKKKKHPVLRAVLTSLLIVIIVVAIPIVSYVALNWEMVSGYVKAAVIGLTTDETELDDRMKQADKQTTEALNNEGINISENDFSKLNDGTLTKEEMTDIILQGMSQNANDGKTENEDDPEKNPVPENGEDTPDITEDKKTEIPENEKQETVIKPEEQPLPEVPVVQDKEEEYKKSLSELVAEIYMVKAEFMATLDSFESGVLAEWEAIPKEERTASKKAQIIADKMSYVAGLEAQCDAQMKSITDKISALMDEHGKEKTLIDTINAAYKTEKENKKAYFVSKYS